MKKKIIVFATIVVLIALACVPLILTNPSKENMENAVTEEFKQSITEVEEKTGRELSPTIIYKDFKVISSYTITCKLTSLRAIRETYLGVGGKVINVDGNALGEFVVNCTKWAEVLLEGAGITISLTVLSVILGLIIAIFLALGKISKLPVISHFCKFYIFFFRGTPLLMQLFFIYYGLPLINPSLTINDRFTAALITFALNSGAYCAEILRAGIESIDKGQFEAAKALGFSYGKTMRKIIIPQTYRRLIPPIANEFIMVLKDASLTSIIALQDLSKVTQTILTSTNEVLVYIPSMCIYLLITWVFTKFFGALEKKFSIYE